MINPIKRIYSKSPPTAGAPKSVSAKPIGETTPRAPAPTLSPRFLKNLPRNPQQQAKFKLVVDQHDSEIAPAAESQSGEISRQFHLSERERALLRLELQWEDQNREAIERLRLAEERERAARELEGLLAAREGLLRIREEKAANNPVVAAGPVLDRLTAVLDQRENRLREMEAALHEREQQIRLQEQNLLDVETLNKLRADLELREKELEDARKKLCKREKSIEEEEARLRKKDQYLNERETELDQREKAAAAKEAVH